MTAPEDSASSNKEAPDREGQTRREHLQMIAAAGVAAASSVDSSEGGQLIDHGNDIWKYDEPLTVSPSLLVNTPTIHIDAMGTDFEPGTLDVRGWGHENEVLLSVEGEFEHGTARPSLVLEREEARRLAHRLLETAQWLAEFEEERDDV